MQLILQDRHELSYFESKFVSLYDEAGDGEAKNKHTVSSDQPILIVEDSDDDFETTEYALQASKFNAPIVRCASGHEAIEYLLSVSTPGNDNKPRPRLVFLDLNLPGVGGKSVLQSIKQKDELKKIPVIVLTTSSDARDVVDCYTLGANSYIQKPTDLDEFIRAVQTLKNYWFDVAKLP